MLVVIAVRSNILGVHFMSLFSFRFIRCKFHSKCGESYLGELKAEDEEGSSSSEDKMDPANLSFLINPESKIKDLG